MEFVKQLSKHKMVEVEVCSFLNIPEIDNSNIFSITFAITKNKHHAGLDFGIHLWKLFSLDIIVYDTRHWDYINRVWVNDDI